MNNLVDLEKKINSELNTKINRSNIKHDQIYLNCNSTDLIEVLSFLKTNHQTKFKQLIDITAADYPENSKRFKLVYLLLSHELNFRVILETYINENEISLVIDKKNMIGGLKKYDITNLIVDKLNKEFPSINLE